MEQRTGKRKVVRHQKPSEVYKRVQRALTLIEADAVRQENRQWKALSLTSGRIYEVNDSGCTCADLFGLCKHRLAGPGRAATLLIAAMMDSKSLAVLKYLARTAGPALCALPEEYRAWARLFYRMRFRALSTPTE